MLIIRMSMDKEKPMMKMLKFVSLLYFFRPFATRFYDDSGQLLPRVKQSSNGYTYAFDNYYEVQVECCIDEKVNHLFGTIPEFIDVYIPLRNLQPRWHPNAVHRYIDCGNEERDRVLQAPRGPLVREEDGTSVDDDLQQELNLQSPCRENGEVEGKAVTGCSCQQDVMDGVSLYLRGNRLTSVV